ncbi:enoyl-CoA hydratase/isomerase family protein [Agromyces seonyuensis]|uniref:Enoyl-CoA hydratase/isomerase family protein n=1 Tax=Agromyces seonyuensis TaxID=2662446 RepID=A0A6I4P6V2_9MICO|nr:enoyl-CoA hydratase/isomerase family protein [Agromyces seonyuensis]MWB99414.1 enoyl-CoA hydratase/isomerase family protein [Agromyces seonyuensis]
MTSPLLVSVDAGVARLTLNRPERLNAIDGATAEAWRDAARLVASDDAIRAVILDAAGRAFCAGGDLVAMGELGGAEGQAREVQRLADVIHEGHALLRSTSKPIVAAVQGPAVGGGLGYMLVADVIVASEASSFAGKYPDVGLTPDCGVSALLPRAIGERRALELLLTSRRLTSDEAYSWGLVSEVVAADELAGRVDEIAAEWAGNANAYGQAKRLAIASLARGLQASLDDEAVTIARAFETPESAARRAAFTARTSR